MYIWVKKFNPSINRTASDTNRDVLVDITEMVEITQLYHDYNGCVMIENEFGAQWYLKSTIEQMHSLLPEDWDLVDA